LAGVASHDHREILPILDNEFRNPGLPAVSPENPPTATRRPHAFLLARNGLYTWATRWLTPSGTWRSSNFSSRSSADRARPWIRDGSKEARHGQYVRIAVENRSLSEEPAVAAAYLAGRASISNAGRRRRRAGRWRPPPTSSRRYDGKIAELKTRGGYVTADVTRRHGRDAAGLDAMLAKFSSGALARRGRGAS